MAQASDDPQQGELVASDPPTASKIVDDFIREYEEMSHDERSAYDAELKRKTESIGIHVRERLGSFGEGMMDILSPRSRKGAFWSFRDELSRIASRATGTTSDLGGALSRITEGTFVGGIPTFASLSPFEDLFVSLARAADPTFVGAFDDIGVMGAAWNDLRLEAAFVGQDAASFQNVIGRIGDAIPKRNLPERLRRDLEEPTVLTLADEIEAALPDEPRILTLEEAADQERTLVRVVHSDLLALADEILRDPRLRFGIHWREFEELVAMLLERNGFRVQLLSGQKDRGRDVIATKIEGYITTTIVGQCKRYGEGRTIDPSVVRELYGTISGRYNGALLATTVELGPGALEEARLRRPQLDWWDGQEFVEQLRLLRQKG